MAAGSQVPVVETKGSPRPASPPAAASRRLRAARALRWEMHTHFLSSAPCRVRFPCMGNKKARNRWLQALRFLWWRRRESNPRPLPCDGSALPAELRPQARLREGYCTVSRPRVNWEFSQLRMAPRELARQQPRRACHARIKSMCEETGEAYWPAKKSTSPPADAIMNPPLKRWVPSPAVPASSPTEDACTGRGIWAPS